MITSQGSRKRSRGKRSCVREALRRRPEFQWLEQRALLAAEVFTDQLDYSPGETAQIMARGFAQGEALQFQVLHNDGTPNTGAGHLPWTVTDGGPTDLDGVVNGQVRTSWYVTPDDSLHSSFTLTAQGLTSSRLATTTFTDSGDLSQFANLPPTQYQNGNLNSNNAAYTEGASVPFRYTVGDATENGRIIVDVIYEYQDFVGGPQTYDYLTTDNVTQPLTDADRFGPADIGGGFDMTTCLNPQLIAIPDDPSPGVPDSGGSFLFCASLPGSTVFTAGYAVTDTTKTIRLVVDLSNDGDATPDEANIDFAIFWGGHLARDIDYPGLDNGSADLSGAGAFHQEVKAWWDRNRDGIRNDGGWTNFDGGGRRNMQPDVIVDTTIAWEKRRDDTSALLGGATFLVTPNPFTGTGSLTVLDNSAPDTDSDAGQFLLGDVLFGTYTITETVAPSGFLIDDVASRTVTVSATTPTAVVGTMGVVDLGNTNSSDFFNTPLTASLSISKSVISVTGGTGDVPGDVITYSVTVTNTGNVTLTGVTVVDPLTGLNISGVTLAPGASQLYNTSYTLTQADLDGAGNAGSDHDIDNTATADSNETGPTSASATVPLVYSPALAIDKVFVNVSGGDGDALADAVGDVLNYTVTVTNTGNVTLTGVTVVDPLTGQNISGVTLAPGASQLYNTSYTLTQADLDGQGNAGSDHDIDNTATADSNETGPTSDSVAVPLVYSPALAIDKVFVNVSGGDGDALAVTV